MTLSYAKSCLIGAIMETLAYGMYFDLFVQSTFILSKRVSIGKASTILFATNILLFILITLRMVLDNHAVVQAFTTSGTMPDAADVYFTQFGPGAMWRTGTYVSLTLVADLFIVYRVYVVWNQHLLVTLFPALLSIGSIVTGGLFLASIHSLLQGGDPTDECIAHRQLIFFTFTMALNLISTIIIAMRVWLLQRTVAFSGLIQSLTNIRGSVSILVESSALYTLSLVATIVPTALESNAQYCMLSALPGIIGISFSLILIRAPRRTHDNPYPTASSYETEHPNRMRDITTPKDETTGPLDTILLEENLGTPNTSLDIEHPKRHDPV